MYLNYETEREVAMSNPNDFQRLFSEGGGFGQSLDQDQEGSDEMKKLFEEMAENLPDGFRFTKEEQKALENGKSILQRDKGYTQIIVEAELEGFKKGKEIEVERLREALFYFNRENTLKSEEMEDLKEELSSEKEKRRAAEVEAGKLMDSVTVLCSVIGGLDSSQSKTALKPAIASLQKQAQEIWGQAISPKSSVK